MESRGLPRTDLNRQATNRQFTKPAPVLRDRSFSQTMDAVGTHRVSARESVFSGLWRKKNGPRRSRLYSASNRLRLLGRMLLFSRRFRRREVEGHFFFGGDLVETLAL